MRVAVVVSTFPPYKGGMGNAAAAHAEALKSAGHEVVVLSPGHDLTPLFRIGNSACVPQLLWKLRGFDAVELHYPFFGGAEWVWFWKKIFGRRQRLIIMYHMDALGVGISALIFRLYRTLFLKPILSAADVILTSSRDYLSLSQASFISKDARVCEIPFGVDTERFHPATSSTRNVVLFVGGLDRAHYFKGVPVLLEAFARVARASSEARLIIAGDGDLRVEYEDRSAALGLHEQVRFVGRVSDSDLPDLYRSATLHVLPSVGGGEAFGIVTAEAAASGIPSIVSDLPGVRSVIEHNVTGLGVPASDVTALADAILKLLGNHALAEAMGRSARERATRLYSSDAVNGALAEALSR